MFPPGINFIKKSLELHLFFARIMKEHVIFLKATFMPRDVQLHKEADYFIAQLDMLLEEVVMLSNGIVSQDVIKSGEVITPFTLKAEMATQYFSGMPIHTQITQAEACLGAGSFMKPTPILEQRVNILNSRAIKLVSALIRFKSNILKSILCCKAFTLMYPVNVHHIMKEAQFYLEMLMRIQGRQETDYNSLAIEQEAFWNMIMAEHGKIIDGMLDPSEEELKETARNFGKEFDLLTEEAKSATQGTVPLEKVATDSLLATEKLQNFKVQGVQGLLNCKIKSIIIPLLGDHVLREANHYLRMLKKGT